MDNKYQKVKISDLPNSLEMVGAFLGSRCYTDPGFRQAFLADPGAAIIDRAKAAVKNNGNDGGQEESMKLIDSANLDGVKLVAHRNTDKAFHIVLPSKAKVKPISEEELTEMHGGALVTAMATMVAAAGGATFLFGAAKAAALTVAGAGLITGSVAAVNVGAAVGVALAAGVGVAGLMGLVGAGAALGIKYNK